MKRCSFVDHDCHECPQTVYRHAKGSLCYYHRKLEKDLLSKVGRYLSETELDSMFGGRTRSDGRRLDNYTR